MLAHHSIDSQGLVSVGTPESLEGKTVRLKELLVGPHIAEELEDPSKEPVGLTAGAADDAEAVDEGGPL